MALKLSLIMDRTLLHSSPFKNPNLFASPPSNHRHLPLRFRPAPSLIHSPSIRRRTGIVTASVVGGGYDESEEVVEKKELAEQSVWSQTKEIVKFTAPAMGLWLCDPLMSLIDTAVVAHGSSTELAALGPATVVCDYMTLTFMFLSVVTSNIIATALAKQDEEGVQHHLSVLLFVGLACGCVMLLSTKLFGAAALTVFTGPKNVHVVPAANTYVQSWYERFLGTLEGFSCCQYYKWSW